MSHRVLCVMLASGRQDMVDRAVRSFYSQTYHDKVLLVLDSGTPAVLVEPCEHIRYWHTHPRSIGELRNTANGLSLAGALDCEIIAHWDSDDWSHPERLSEQVALLESSGKQAVGYGEVLFWDATAGQFCGAWLYRNQHPTYCIGSSLCYWRDVWLERQFADKHTAEDTEWLMRVKSHSATSLCTSSETRHVATIQPRMICSIHGGNTASKIQPGAREWVRVAQWDAICRETMRL